MLDIKFIRQNPDKIKQALKKRGMIFDVDDLLKTDEKKKEILNEIEEIFFKKNKANKEILLAKTKQEKDKIIDNVKKFSEKEKKLKENLKIAEKKFEELMFQLPNMPSEQTIEGKDEKQNKTIKQWGKIPNFDFETKDHIELGKALDIIDSERAAKVSGSRFYYLKNEAVLLEFALIFHSFNILAEQGFALINPPLMIKEKPYIGMGRLSPQDKEERYYIPKDELYLIGSAEHTIGPMHSDEIFREEELPKRYVGFSSCLRREAGSYGKDTKGILRSHQFDKIEMFSFVAPENSPQEHKFLLSLQEKLMQSLNLPYQVVSICSGDMGFTDAEQYDIETWLPGQKKYRETQSCSNTTDFQARGINCRYKNKKGKLEFVHMLNATGFAIGRTLIAILENYQRKDGSVAVPEVLQKYAGIKEITPK